MNAFLNENLTGMSTVQLLEPRARATSSEFRAINAEHRDANLRGRLLPRAVLPGARTGRRDRGVADRLVRRPPGHVDRHHARHAGGVHPVHAALLPPDLGPVARSTASCSRRWRPPSASSTCSTRRPIPPRRARRRSARRRAPARGPRRAPRAVAPGRIEFDHVWFAYQRRALGARGRLVHDRARRAASRWWAPPARARPRSPACCCASTRRSAARSASTAGRSRTGTRRRCAAASGSCCRTCSCSRARSRATCALGDAGARPRERARARRARGARRTTFIERLPGRLRRRGRASAARRSRPASASCWRSPARWRATRDLLILDEATSSVDTHTETPDPGRAAPAHARAAPRLVIAHRLSHHPGRGPDRGAAPRPGARGRDPRRAAGARRASTPGSTSSSTWAAQRRGARDAGAGPAATRTCRTRQIVDTRLEPRLALLNHVTTLTSDSPSRRWLMQLGKKIRDLRLRRGLTVQQLADATGLSKGFISQVENDRTSPSLATLHDLARALETSVAYLVVEEDQVPYVVRADERPQRAGRRQHLAGRGALRPAQAQPRAAASPSSRPGVSAGDKRHYHHGEEVRAVPRGPRAGSRAASTCSCSRRGDSCHYDGRVPHAVENAGDRDRARADRDDARRVRADAPRAARRRRRTTTMPAIGSNA